MIHYYYELYMMYWSEVRDHFSSSWQCLVQMTMDTWESRCYWLSLRHHILEPCLLYITHYWCHFSYVYKWQPTISGSQLLHTHREKINYIKNNATHERSRTTRRCRFGAANSARPTRRRQLDVGTIRRRPNSTRQWHKLPAAVCLWRLFPFKT